MAAPASAYHNNGNAVISLHKVAVSKADCYPAINIYGSADLKALFYLDGFLIFPQKQTDGTIIESFLGYVLEGGTNIGMHNGARWIKTYVPVKLPNGTVKNAVVLNDAGLNVKGTLGALTMLSKAVGDIRPQLFFKSAFWNETTEFGFYYRNASESGGVDVKVSVPASLPKNSEGYYSVTINVASINAGDLIRIKGFITNEEGTNISDDWLISFYAEARPISAKYHATYASSAYNGLNTKTIYLGTSEIKNGSKVYANADITLAADTGYYTIADKWYRVDYNFAGEYSYVAASGNCTPTGWPAGDPQRDNGTYTEYQAHYSASSSSASCTIYNQGGPTQAIFRRDYDGKYYTSSLFTAFVADGYYTISGGVDNGRWRRIIDGVAGSNGTCGGGGGTT